MHSVPLRDGVAWGRGPGRPGALPRPLYGRRTGQITPPDAGVGPLKKGLGTDRHGPTGRLRATVYYPYSPSDLPPGPHQPGRAPQALDLVGLTPPRRTVRDRSSPYIAKLYILVGGTREAKTFSILTNGDEMG